MEIKQVGEYTFKCVLKLQFDENFTLKIYNVDLFSGVGFIMLSEILSVEEKKELTTFHNKLLEKGLCRAFDKFEVIECEPKYLRCKNLSQLRKMLVNTLKRWIKTDWIIRNKKL